MCLCRNVGRFGGLWNKNMTRERDTESVLFPLLLAHHRFFFLSLFFLMRVLLKRISLGMEGWNVRASHPVFH